MLESQSRGYALEALGNIIWIFPGECILRCNSLWIVSMYQHMKGLQLWLPKASPFAPLSSWSDACDQVAPLDLADNFLGKTQTISNVLLCKRMSGRQLSRPLAMEHGLANHLTV